MGILDSVKNPEQVREEKKAARERAELLEGFD